MQKWPLVEADLHDMYGIDVGDKTLMRSRSWDWLKTRITGLLDAPKNIAPDGTLIPVTRLGWALDPPKPKNKTKT